MILITDLLTMSIDYHIAINTIFLIKRNSTLSIWLSSEVFKEDAIFQLYCTSKLDADKDSLSTKNTVSYKFHYNQVKVKAIYGIFLWWYHCTFYQVSLVSMT